MIDREWFVTLIWIYANFEGFYFENDNHIFHALHPKSNTSLMVSLNYSKSYSSVVKFVNFYTFFAWLKNGSRPPTEVERHTQGFVFGMILSWMTKCHDKSIAGLNQRSLLVYQKSWRPVYWISHLKIPYRFC